MVRIYMKHVRCDGISQFREENITDIDIENDKLEEILSRGGYGETGYEYFKVIDAKVLTKEKPNE